MLRKTRGNPTLCAPAGAYLMHIMPDYRPTYEIASAQIAHYVQPLWPGAQALPIDLRDENGRKLSLADDHLGGRNLLIVFVNDARRDTAVPVLSALAQAHERLLRTGLRLLLVSAVSDAAHNRALKMAAGLSEAVAGDSTGAVRRPPPRTR